MISESVVDLSRLQFAMTALYHFLFVPLTLGMAFLLAIMESVYVMTGKPIYTDMTRFWGKLFGINFALGVTTGLTMEFQFGTNWAYYSHYVGDIFGAPLAIEGMMAFFLESTFIGLFFFGWDRLTRVQHLTVTWLVALGSFPRPADADHVGRGRGLRPRRRFRAAGDGLAGDVSPVAGLGADGRGLWNVADGASVALSPL